MTSICVCLDIADTPAIMSHRLLEQALNVLCADKCTSGLRDIRVRHIYTATETAVLCLQSTLSIRANDAVTLTPSLT